MVKTKRKALKRQNKKNKSRKIYVNETKVKP